MTTDSPGVRVPPPFWYAGAVLVGALLDRAWPLPLGVRPAWRSPLALLCAAAWFGLMAGGMSRFLRARTTILPMRPASALVTSGPYRFTRNPMYLGLALLTLGFALFFNTWWIVVLLVPALIVVDRAVIAREEAYLRRRFGGEYEAYRRRVRRWL
jgi:protein-S-isoprenylcysteine O-methyltransferase Ste14